MDYGLAGKTVLVTGATGFIGAHLLSRLRTIPGARVFCLSRKPPHERQFGEVWIQGSLETLSPQTWESANIDRFDTVFHLGAFIPKSHATANRIDDVFRDNLCATRALLESFVTPPDKVVFASTMDIYALPAGTEKMTEASPIAPATLYGASKFFCEKLVTSWAGEHKSRAAILRYGHIFGPGEDAYQKLIPQTIRQLLRGESPVLYGDGSAARDFLYVADAVEATLRAAIAETDFPPVNVARGESEPIRATVERLMRITEFKGDIRFLADKPSGYSLQFDNTHLTGALGAWPLVSLNEGLAQEVEYFRRLSHAA